MNTWLRPIDEDLFGATAADRLPGLGWSCSHPGPVDRRVRHVHPNVAEALACGGVQAFVPIPVGGGHVAAHVQLLRSTVYDDGAGRYLRGGRLATRWFEDDVGPDLHAILTSQCDLIWGALRQCTRPAPIRNDDGVRVRGSRIGLDALDFVRREGLLLGPMAGNLRYRVDD